MNRLSLMVLALTMSSPTLLAGVVENCDFKENHTGYTLYFKQSNDNEARLMQLNIDNYDTEIVIPSVVKDTYGYEFKVTAIGQLYTRNITTNITTKTSTLAIWVSVPAFLEMSAIVPTT